jgi:hypothetical protein
MALRIGISPIHGAHQVAQKLSTLALPETSASVKVVPSAFLSTGSVVGPREPEVGATGAAGALAGAAGALAGAADSCVAWHAVKAKNVTAAAAIRWSFGIRFLLLV